MSTLILDDKVAVSPQNREGLNSLPGTSWASTGASREIWFARAFLICVAVSLAWFTWGHWGDFQVDNGRELYVPAEILKGKLLFRDLWYMYGPLAPYAKALLFWIFGVRLTVLYVFGLTLTIGTALVTYEIARQFRLGSLGSMVPSLFFLTEAFYPSIRNFVFPYSYAASLGAFLGSCCLYFVLRSAGGARTWHLSAAALMAGLAVLTKQEFGVACLGLLGIEVIGSYWARRFWSEFARNLSVCFAGMLPAAAGYGWFVWKTSARFIFFDNWIATPGTYFMRTFGKLTISEQGLRFVPSELLLSAEYTALGLVLWAMVARLAFLGIEKLGLRSRLSVSGMAIAALAPLWLAAIAFVKIFPLGMENSRQHWSSLVIPVSQSVFPRGIFFLALFFIAHAMWKMAKAPRNEAFRQEAELGVYASLVAVRQMMALRPTIWDCAVFFNVLSFLIFLILVYRIIGWACRALDAERTASVATTMLAGEAVMAFLLFFPRPQMLTTRLETDNGTLYTKSDAAELVPQIVSFMKTHTKNGKDILVLPEPPSFYTFAGMDAPSRWYSVLPGVIAPNQEHQYIDELASNQVRYVLIANRILVEYGVQGFANGGYDLPIYNWITAHYARVGQFGPTPEGPIPPYIVWIYQRKDLPQADVDQGLWLHKFKIRGVQ